MLRVIVVIVRCAIFAKSVRALKRLGRKIQTLIVQFLLAFLYLLGFGLTSIWISLFHRGLFRSRSKDQVSYWLTAENRSLDLGNSENQS